MNEQVSTHEKVAEEVIAFTGVPVGEQLRLARESRGIELLDIAQTLKLGPRQVEALESGDWKGLPGNTFVRGFVRNYARLMQIDPVPLMLQLDQALEKPVNTLAVSDSPPAEMPHSGSTVSRRSRLVVVLGAIFVVLSALAYFLMAGNLSSLRESTQSLLDSLARKQVDAPTVAAPAVPVVDPVFPPGSTPQQVMNPQVLAPIETPAELPVAKVPEASVSRPDLKQPSSAPLAAPVATAPQMRFLFEKDSWLEVRDRDNKLVFSQKLTAGTEQTLSGQGPLSIKIGYAPGVRLFWHGEAVDLAPHTRGDVARLVLE
ncbi:MAG: helix-turn-helix domain-containing protein [Betaproteobacteria bacterium]|nr:helix-turn-helix domain-containing protein [Betaproteobacteria bacterium]